MGGRSRRWCCSHRKGVIERDIEGHYPDKDTLLVLYCGGDTVRRSRPMRCAPWGTPGSSRWTVAGEAGRQPAEPHAVALVHDHRHRGRAVCDVVELKVGFSTANSAISGHPHGHGDGALRSAEVGERIDLSPHAST